MFQEETKGKQNAKTILKILNDFVEKVTTLCSFDRL